MSRFTGYGRVVLKSRERPFAGAQLGIDDAQAVSRRAQDRLCARAPQRVLADRVAPAVVEARDARHPFLHRRCPGRSFRPLVDTIRGRDILVFNATAADDALRRNLSAAEVVHTLPSLAMSMDGLVQYLVSRVDQLSARRSCAPMRSWSGRSRAPREIRRPAGGKAAVHAGHGSARAGKERSRAARRGRDYDVVFVADHAFDFARRVPYAYVRGRW